ncbi:conjugal transfer protein TraO (plasmid) [Spirosoma sp. SC4-14]|uniref:conjugal transfer protein TraO n=1 Tax=Spirosoma sp. SC4-14 TaxID=3128900 RepID=UPI0030D3DA3E
MLLVHSGYAQRHIKGQNAVSFTAGVVDNFPKFSTPHAPGRGYAGSIDYIWYRKNERYWKTSFNYIRKYYDALTAKKPVVEQYWLAIDYVPRGIYTTRRWLYVAPTAGLYVGYEAVNRNQLDLPEGIIQNQSTASIGPQAGLEGEAYVSPSLALIVGITERFIPFSEVSQFRTTGYIGIRFCFFR